jgi:hypothetical protein
MERRLTEENITTTLLVWLEKNGWEIICYDFPQSGTGLSIHPNENIRTSKNKGAIIPDIVAVRKSIVVFFENKDRFVLNDFMKLQQLKEGVNYSNSLNKLLAKFKPSHIYFGTGLPDIPSVALKCISHLNKIDFVVLVSEERKIRVHYQVCPIF